MNIDFRVLLVAMLFAFSCADRADADKIEQQAPVENTPTWSIAIHGGAGNFDGSNFPEELDAAYRNSLNRAVQHGAELLEAGEEATEVVKAVLVMLEDDSLFNAGRGAVLTADRSHELDASIMRGSDRNAGAVTGLARVKNPILAADLVMRESPHVFLSGEGAADFAHAHGLDSVPNSYFTTNKAKRSLERWRASQASEEEKKGTVGCVVRDTNGHLAAGTSTGGMTGKQHGRIGDSPLIAAGTWADDASCAVSCTGHGEYFIRAAVAHQIAARMKFGGMDLKEAASSVVQDDLLNLGGDGGVIAVDHRGEVVMVFNTLGMFRASQRAGEKPYVAMYDSE